MVRRKWRSPLETRDCKTTRFDAFFDSKERKYFITPQKRRAGDRGGQIERCKRKIMDLQLQSERRLRRPAAPPTLEWAERVILINKLR
jgi:hypothetical protein